MRICRQFLQKVCAPTVRQRAIGEKRPSDAALKLLIVIEYNGVKNLILSVQQATRATRVDPLRRFARVSFREPRSDLLLRRGFARSFELLPVRRVPECFVVFRASLCGTPLLHEHVAPSL
jgi:hypothetical protein